MLSLARRSSNRRDFFCPAVHFAVDWIINAFIPAANPRYRSMASVVDATPTTMDDVRAALAKGEITQSELARLAHVSQPTVSHAMNPEKKVLHDTALRLIAALAAYRAEKGETR